MLPVFRQHFFHFLSFIMSIKIGFLSYYSSIYPDMASDMVAGFFAALPEGIVQENFFLFVPEYMRQAGNKYAIEGVQKLISFDRVDIISGLISYRVVPDIVQLVERQNRLGFFMDMGEYIPYNHHISDRLFFNSFQYWQSEYALGFWAHKTFGELGSVVMSLFDSGFHLQNAFRQGAILAGASAIEFSVLTDDPGRLNVTDKTRAYIARIEQAPPKYVHAILCGKEAIDFMKVYRESSLYSKVPLIISAHMASEDILDQIDTDLSVYAASLYNYGNIDKYNTAFKKNYEFKAGRKANVFSLMGFEMGLVMLELMPLLRKRDFVTAAQQLKTQTIRSPRGERSFYLDSSYALPVIDIEKVDVQNRQVKKIVVEQGRALKYNHAIYDEIHSECVSGWQNPYLCV